MFITVTGPECSGKTAMTLFLGEQLDLCVVTEYAREYLQQLGRPYVQEDLTQIANGQLSAARRALADCRNGVVSDTHLLVMQIWSEWKYGAVLPELAAMLHDMPPDLYVLCKPDIPWEYDPLRESPRDREVLYEIYLDKIQKSGIPFIVAESLGEGREERVLADIADLRKTLP